MPVLTQKGTGRRMEVPDESVQFWADRGYSLPPEPKSIPDPKPAPKRRAPRKKQ